MIEEIRQRLESYAHKEIDHEGYPRAAVLVPLYYRDGTWHVVLTRRSQLVEHHKGEISFPGGSMDPGDADLQATALRESFEEIGLQPEDVTIIGTLDHRITISNFHVACFVGEIDPLKVPYEWKTEPDEVDKILEVPLEHIQDIKNYCELPRLRNGETVLVGGCQFEEDIIFGATWYMLRNFLDVAVEEQIEALEEKVEALEEKISALEEQLGAANERK